MALSFLLATGIAAGSIILCYNHVSSNMYKELERMYGKEMEAMTIPEREEFLFQKVIRENRKQPIGVTPTFTDFRYSGYKRFAKRRGVDLGRVMKEYERGLREPTPD